MSLGFKKDGKGINVSGTINQRNVAGLLRHLGITGGIGSLISGNVNLELEKTRVNDIMVNSVKSGSGMIDITFNSKNIFQSATTYLRNCGELTRKDMETVNRYLSDFPSGQQSHLKNEL